MGKPIGPKPRGTDERDFDTSSMHEKLHGRFVHRDYAAHYFRWGFVHRMISGGDKVLEVGCGEEFPLCKTFMHRVGQQPKRYVGVDLNPLPKAYNLAWAKWFGEFDFCSRYMELPRYNDVVVHLEVIEHMQPEHGFELLAGCHHLLKKRGLMICSTPVFNGRQANNHIHEYTVDELRGEIEAAGFRVLRRHGTFMNVTEVTKKKSRVAPEHRAVFEELREYYSNDVLSTFLAPLYPDLSRNNIWICEKR